MLFVVVWDIIAVAIDDTVSKRYLFVTLCP